jgi:hypothetical protein
MKKSLSFLQEARLPTIPWGPVGDQLEEEMDPSTTYWRTIISMNLQEDPSPLPGDPRVDHHRRLDAANQVWQGPYWAVRTQNRIQCLSVFSLKSVRLIDLVVNFVDELNFK